MVILWDKISRHYDKYNEQVLVTIVVFIQTLYNYNLQFCSIGSIPPYSMSLFSTGNIGVGVTLLNNYWTHLLQSSRWDFIQINIIKDYDIKILTILLCIRQAELGIMIYFGELFVESHLQLSHILWPIAPIACNLIGIHNCKK